MRAQMWRPVVVAALIVVLAAMAGASVAYSAPSASGRYLVVFKSGTLPADAAQRVASNGGIVVRSLAPVGVIAAIGDDAFVSKMSKDAKVQSVGTEHSFGLPDTTSQPLEEDDAAVVEGAPTAADNLYGFQWNMRRIGAPNVWARLPLSGITPRVAVLDVGVADNHPDLVGQLDRSVSTSYCPTSGGPQNKDGYPIYSSLIDFTLYPNWTPADGCTAAATTYEFHGTHVAGIVAAKFGGGRIVGVAPDAKVGAYKVFDRYSFTTADNQVAEGLGAFDGPLFDAIIQATQAGYPVINLSLGSTLLRNDKGSNASWLAWNRVAQYANRNGALIVASAGNSTIDLNGAIAHVPGDIATIMNTSATGMSQLELSSGMYQPAPGAHDVLAFYSNFGSPVDIAAPGGDCGPDPNQCLREYFILSAGISVSGVLNYTFAAGTSMATPHVSATAAYVRALHPLWTPGAVRSWLKDTAQPIGDRQLFGAGLVDADAAAH